MILILENLKGLKKNTINKCRKSLKNKYQRWCYTKVLKKLKRLCEENGVLLYKINPANTSQRCSKCRKIHKDSRRGTLFKCVFCGMEMDADINAAINILHEGVYNLFAAKSEEQLISAFY